MNILPKKNSDSPTHDAPAAVQEELAGPDPTGVGSDMDLPVGEDHKSAVLAQDYRETARFFGYFILIAIGLAIAGWGLKYLWTGLLPVILAVLVSTVTVPVSSWLRRHWRFPAGLASITTLLAFFAIIGGIFTAMAPTVRAQGADLINQAQDGIEELIELIENLPVDIQADRIQEVVDEVTTVVKNQASSIATGVMSGFSTVSSIVVGLVIMLFLTFFFTKDGDKFLPWLRKFIGAHAGWHATELLNRIWKTLSGFIQAQAAVAAVDAILIGLGLWIMQVPLALVIGVVTFFASFIPMIGAIVAGALAVIIALVSKGLTSALIALVLIIAVQQIEGNVLQPLLQSKAMGLHAAIVLLAVTVGSAMAGIVGAFLAVPVAATLGVIARYHALTTSLRAGEVSPEDAEIVTGGEETPSTPRGKVRELYRLIAPGDSPAAAHGVSNTNAHASKDSDATVPTDFTDSTDSTDSTRPETR
ncbi:AI-2E family transporter [uncultured Corynebacterium sp.]|uniref:AI-2E family transporter n=1 Tax=uncultured Corynebacterium sp. TaxID=159447 RepID=UPI0025EB2E96|nr:AI-2E family transporter [uncultured Corynebacterium sp.]